MSKSGTTTAGCRSTSIRPCARACRRSSTGCCRELAEEFARTRREGDLLRPRRGRSPDRAETAGARGGGARDRLPFIPSLAGQQPRAGALPGGDRALQGGPRGDRRLRGAGGFAPPSGRCVRSPIRACGSSPKPASATTAHWSLRREPDRRRIPIGPRRLTWPGGASLVEIPPLTWGGPLRLPAGGWCGRAAAPRWILARRPPPAAARRSAPPRGSSLGARRTSGPGLPLGLRAFLSRGGAGGVP